MPTARATRKTVPLVRRRRRLPRRRGGHPRARAADRRPAGALVVGGAALYQALQRLERKKLVRASWGVSEHKRRAKFYELTARGRQQLQAQTETLRTYIAALALVLAALGVYGVMAHAVAAAASRVLAGLLVGVGTHDAVTFVATPLVLLAVAAAACLVPARRATRSDPVSILRAD